ncbi:hypothetical protein Halha_1544 [Halobacteroides halobius DSM 5150]|uniref:Bacterial repeat domain-containing protein n=1 Tax=Halobacteroides halobius (strain ATCC 35273 / DSM 5150 / MD-1) TaxID=748449 RepID=L0KBM0_HALHC|nr:leucine-rich repeat domain-containing protein [Halobacteroides halobius]AGB41483.1 hypothetical protein Halha_1544 [Halobacteroides halobius DSM 5150]
MKGDKIISLTLILLLSLVLVGCLEANAASNKVKLTIYKLGKGEITPKVGTHTYKQGATITLKAVAKKGYSFNKWSSKGINELNKKVKNCELVLDQDLTITAVFSDGKTLNFVDYDIEQVLRKKLQKWGKLNQHSNNILKEDVYGVKSLNIEGVEIESFQGLQFMPDLNYLDIRESKVTGNLFPLAKSNNLRQLIIREKTKLKDISQLDLLTQLKDLTLENHQLTELSQISNLSQLSRLNISSSSLKSIKGIENFTKLKRFTLQNGKVADISTLSQLTNLKRITINDLPVKDISPLSNLNNLKYLTLSELPVDESKDLTKVLKSMNNLKRLSLTDLKINRVDFLKGISQLSWLNLSRNSFSNLEKLKEHILRINNLSTLWLSQLGLENIDFLLKLDLNELKEVYIRGNNLDLSKEAEDMKVINKLKQKGVQVIYKWPWQ